MSIVFKNIPGLTINDLFPSSVTEGKKQFSEQEMIDIAGELATKTKIPQDIRELIERCGEATQTIRDIEVYAIPADQDEVTNIVKAGLHFGRCSCSPLNNAGEGMSHEIVITVVENGKSNVLILNV